MLHTEDTVNVPETFILSYNALLISSFSCFDIPVLCRVVTSQRFLSDCKGFTFILVVGFIVYVQFVVPIKGNKISLNEVLFFKVDNYN